MRPVMYIFANRGLGMSPGKLAAQVAHAAVEAFRISDKDLVDAWYVGKHHTKLVMEARDTEHLLSIERYLNERGFQTTLIIDEGRTEIPPHTPTALGIEIVDKTDPDVQASFGDFISYKERPKADPEPSRGFRTFVTNLHS